MLLTVRDVVNQTLRELIRIRIGELKDTLAYGGGVATFEAYREAVGTIRGLNEALELADEAEKRASERERGI